MDRSKGQAEPDVGAIFMYLLTKKYPECLRNDSGRKTNFRRQTTNYRRVRIQIRIKNPYQHQNHFVTGTSLTDDQSVHEISLKSVYYFSHDPANKQTATQTANKQTRRRTRNVLSELITSCQLILI